MKKILIIYTSVGLGHKVVAENIARALRSTPHLSSPLPTGQAGTSGEEQKEGGVEVVMLDILRMYRSRFTKGYEGLYTRVINYIPWLWRFFYNSRLWSALTLPLRLPLAAAKAKKMREYLEKEKPDLVLTTQTTATAMMSYLKGKGLYRGKLVAAFSDYHFHPYWVYPGVDHFLLNIPEQAAGVAKYGYGRDQMSVVGLPVDEDFAGRPSLTDILKRFDLSRTRPLILVMGGSRGWGIRKKDIEELLRTDLDIQIGVITGTNQKLAERLRSARHSGNLKVYGQLRNSEVARLFSVARLLVTKPGGLTVGQAMAAGLPMILANPLPGMEEKNLDYLLSAGAAVQARSPAEIRKWMERLLRDQPVYSELKKKITALARPDAAGRAAGVIVDMFRE